MWRACAILEFSLEHVSYSMAHVDMSVKLLGFHAMLPCRRERRDNGGKSCHDESWEHTNRGRVEVPKASVCSVGASQPRVLTNKHKPWLTHRTMRRKNHKGREFSIVLSHSQRFSYREEQSWDTLPMTPSWRLDCAMPA